MRAAAVQAELITWPASPTPASLRRWPTGSARRRGAPERLAAIVATVRQRAAERP